MMSGSLWRDRDFMKLWTGQTVSQLGSRITRDGVPLAAAMVLGAGPFQMAILNTANGAAVLLLGLYAGVWVDRLRRRPIMIWADAGRALLLGAIPLAAFTHRLTMPLLYIVAASAGVLTVFFDVAYQTYLPSLVERENVFVGNSKLAMSASIAEVLGPALTGVLVKALTAPVAILLDAVSFVFSAVSVAVIRKPERKPAPRRTESPLKDAMAGLQFIRREPVLRSLAAYSASIFFCFGIISPLYVLFAIRDLQMGPVLLELSIACGGVASFIGSAVAKRASRRFGTGSTLIASAGIFTLGTFLIPSAHGPLAVRAAFLIAAQLISDSSMVVYNVYEISIRQTIAPEQVLGRVNASMRLLTFGIMPFGALAGGALATAIGMRGAMYLAATGMALAIGWLAGAFGRWQTPFPGEGEHFSR
jgi:MFS family permease